MILNKLRPTEVYDTYWKFAAERQSIFFRRMFMEERPWTDDEILGKYKFTNAYRASDRVSQYLIRNVIYSDEKFSPEDTCFRILLFKMFNKIETWEYLEQKLEAVSYSSYCYEEYERLLTQRLMDGQKIFSAAYIMPSGKSSFGYSKKHQNNLKLLEFMMRSKLPVKIAGAKTLEEVYKILLSFPMIGSFLAFQYAIDLNYSELCDFSEMEFVVAGPGAKNGIRKCFQNSDKYKYEDIIRAVAENQEKEFESRGLKFETLFGRRLQLIDCQNLFCETDKYARMAHPDICGLDDRKTIKQRYKQRYHDRIDYFYPPKWGINDKIAMQYKNKCKDSVHRRKSHEY